MCFNPIQDVLLRAALLRFEVFFEFRQVVLRTFAIPLAFATEPISPVPDGALELLKGGWVAGSF